MNSKLFKRCSLTVLLLGSMLSQTHAEDENIDVTQQSVTNEELAAIFVLSEVCPTLDQAGDKFDHGYAKLLKEYLPNEKKPVTALNTLAQQDTFKAVLDEARSDAKKAGDADNIQICQDVSNFNS
mgnify:CR=1 FL=1